MGVVAVLSPRLLVVEALTIAGCELRVTNAGPGDDEYRFQLVGDAAPWGFFGGLNSVALPAGGEGTAKVLFRLPRAASPPAGTLSFGVKVASVNDPGVSTVAEGELDVARFSDLLASLQPRNARAAGTSEHDLMLVNRGNSPVRAGLTAGGSDGHLDVRAEPAALEAPPGGTATAKVRVSPKRRLRGQAVDRPFEVVVTPDGGEAIRVDGTLTQEPVRRPRSVLVGAVVLGLLIAAGAVVALTSGGGSGGAPGPAASGTTAETVNPACPAQGHYNRNRAASGALPFNYSFLEVAPDGCQPVRFNPCDPIHYVVNPTDAPPGGVDDVQEAFRRIAAAAGYTFVDDGLSSTDRFDFRRQAYLPAVYGERWAPIVVSWSHLGNRGANDVVVAGMGQQFDVDGVLVTGMLNLNADARSDLARQNPLPNGFGKGISWGKVMLHELGHVFGLGHVESKGEIMHEQLLEQTLPDANYGIGDLTAWRLIGRQAGCVQTPAPRTVAPLVNGPPPTAAPAR